MNTAEGTDTGTGSSPEGEATSPDGRDLSEAVAVIGRQLSEPGRFAYAGLCGVSLGQLFSGPEHRCFREQYLEGLVSWLRLDESVMPVMGAFLAGLGYEGSDTFLSILQGEPLLSSGSTPIVQDLVSFSVKDGQYDARARVLIRHVSCLLRVAPQRLGEFEETLGEGLREGGEESEEESSRRRRKERGRKLRRYLLIGLATVGGGTVIVRVFVAAAHFVPALLRARTWMSEAPVFPLPPLPPGVTGGLAAPLVAAGAGAVLGAGGAAALGSAAGIAIMASLFGAAGAGLAGYKMNKRVGAIEEFEFLPLSSGKRLHVTIAVTGWLCSGKYSSFQSPWSSLGVCGEQYCLVWESRFLRDLGSALASLVDGLVSIVAQEALKYTVLSGIVTALMWPASILAVASVIDNPWGVCLSRSAEVGKHLAQVLRSRQQGKRPVSLIGFSLGARVIYFCLQELANDTGSEGVVEDAILLGAPVDGSAKQWERMCKVVAGNIVNGYCRGDWLLGFLYRGSSAQLCVAGLQPINLDDRRMVNVDLSSVVNGHLDYMRQMDTILVAVGVPTRERAGVLTVLSPQTKGEGPDTGQDQSAEEGGVSRDERAEPGDRGGGVAEEKPVRGGDASDVVRPGEELKRGGGEEGLKEECADGWDIPDISDLLDSLNDADVPSQHCPLGSSVDGPDQNIFSKDKGLTPEPLCGAEGVEGTDWDSEHTHWDWDTTHWTTEHSDCRTATRHQSQNQQPGCSSPSGQQGAVSPQLVKEADCETTLSSSHHSTLSKQSIERRSKDTNSNFY
ncbi:transmembrane and coiled-coil domain-containing protein 4 isoform X2 [Anguilla anguilla]|uniref:transmembrane and coiled-coil domain-containing protein 4 isoform X2 n=1 Tax=Anguilla anguilla TaxID=7936 RepID=UPI0015B055CF|nr:transmembrane and coiled-coil domain-containing protein 4 isoform X2 [Anguilla anguilla]